MRIQLEPTGNHQFRVIMSEAEMLTFYAALEKYQSGMKRDMETHYDGAANYSSEDDEFLGHQIAFVSRMMAEVENNPEARRVALIP